MKSQIVSSYQTLFNSDERNIYNDIYAFIMKIIFVTFIYLIFTVSLFALHSNVQNNESDEFLMNVSVQNASQLKVQANFNVLAGIFLIFLFLFFRKRQLLNFKVPQKPNKKQLFLSNLPLNIENNDFDEKHLQANISEKGFLIRNVTFIYENSKSLFRKISDTYEMEPQKDNKNAFVGKALLTFANMHGFYFIFQRFFLIT